MLTPKSISVPIMISDRNPDLDGQVRIRKRGTAMSSPLADVFSEVVLFSMDRSVTRFAKDANLHRLHDDFWIWGPQDACSKAWHAVAEFTRVMGLDINKDKSGSAVVSQKKTLPSTVAPHQKPVLGEMILGGSSSEDMVSLPAGNIAWGFLVLDADTGRFKIDGPLIEKHVQDLRLRLDSEKSILGYVKAWNHISVRFFTSMLGKPANCLGRPHVDMILEAFRRVQRILFPSGSVTEHLKGEISRHFNIQDIPDGFLYFPLALGGLDLQNPFIPYYQVRTTITLNPHAIMDEFFSREKDAFENAKAFFEKERLAKRKKGDFMSFDDYTRYREQTSSELLTAYEKLLAEPKNQVVKPAHEVEARELLAELSDYQRWVLHLYGAEMIKRFGGLSVVEKRLLPTGLVQLFGQSRMKW